MTQQNYAEIQALQGSYIARHWRGDISLGKSYWINGAVVGIVFYIVWSILLAVLAVGVADRSAQVLGLVVLIAAQVTLYTWQVVGVWRSAGKHESRGGKKFWAILARIGLCLGLLVALKTLANNIDVTSKLASNSNYYLLPYPGR
jgi:hypothetical protein